MKDRQVVLILKLLLNFFCQLYTCHPTLAPTTGTSVNGSMGQESYKENIK